MTLQKAAGLMVLGVLMASGVQAQTSTDVTALRGLAPFATLARSEAVAVNYTVMHGIQTGVIRQATPLPFRQQQQQALKDVFITSGNLAQLADGLGSTLEGAYVARAHYLNRKGEFTSVSVLVKQVIAYANETTFENSQVAKYFFGNLTRDGKAAASSEALAVLEENHGIPDVYGESYHLKACLSGVDPKTCTELADPLGNSRPFQTYPNIVAIVGPDYLNVPADTWVYNHGPLMDLTASPSFPSGHTTYGYTGAIILAVLVPDRYPQLMVRAAEYGNDRILVGAHYPMDVIAARTLALYDLAHLLANDRSYVGQQLGRVDVIKDFQSAVKAARKEVTSLLEAACGSSISKCAAQDTGRFNSPQANEAFYESTLTYSLPAVYPDRTQIREDVATLAPEAKFLLKVAFPALSDEEANQILTETEGPGGGFLDDGKSPFGVYSRLDLYAASEQAIKRLALKTAGAKAVRAVNN